MYDVSSFRSSQLVFLDETRVDRSIGIHGKGWASRGKRPRQVKRFHRGQRFQILPAYTQDVIHFRVYEGSIDTEIFENFIEELLPYCGRWPAPKSVLTTSPSSTTTTNRLALNHNHHGEEKRKIIYKRNSRNEWPVQRMAHSSRERISRVNSSPLTGPSK